MIVLRMLKKYLENNYTKDLTTSIIVTNVRNMSHITLKLCKQDIKSIVNEAGYKDLQGYLMKFRCEKARELLEKDELHRYTIQQIAAKVGIYSVRNFCKYYKKHMGVLPSAHRTSTRQMHIKRCSKARKLLIEYPFMNVDEVATKAAYGSRERLYVNYKKVYGIAPEQERDIPKIIYNLVVEAIEDNYKDKDYSIEKFEIDCCICTVQKTLKRWYGKTFKGMLCNFRIKRAKYYLREGYTLEATAKKVGYSYESFLKAFVKTNKCGPTEWYNKNVRGK